MQAAKKIAQFDDYESYKAFIDYQNKIENDMVLEAKREKEKNVRYIKRFMKTLLIAAMVFSVMAVVVVRYSAICEEQYKVIGLQNEIKQMNMDIDELKSSLDSTISLDNVERVATQELNMQYPQPEQIVYIKSNWNYALDQKETVTYAEKKVPKRDYGKEIYAYIMNFAFNSEKTK